MRKSLTEYQKDVFEKADNQKTINFINSFLDGFDSF